MKLKTIVSSMAVLGLISTSAFAATQPTTVNSDDTGWLSQDAYWLNIIDRNQDNAYLVVQKAGQMKFSGYLATDFTYNSKRSGYSTAAGNGDGVTGISLSVMELYFDAQLNPWVSGHVALDYDNDNSNGGFAVSNDETAPTIDTQYGQTHMFFDEAYAMFNYNNFFAKVGRQYANFGSTMHNTISSSLTQSLSSINETGVTLGAVSKQGFYGDVFLYQGSPYGTVQGTSPNYDYNTVNDNATMLHGYTVNVGYALNQGQNAFYGNDGGNYFINYIGNMSDVTSIKSTLSTHGGAWTLPSQQVGGIAAHADYAKGPFQVMLDYVTALTKYDETVLAYDGKGAQPSAYSVQATYSWNQTNTQSVTLGYDGSQQAHAITPMGSSFTTPASRFLVSYGYVPYNNVKLRLQYDNAQDYGTSVGGTGQSNNTVTARVQIIF